MLIMVLNSVSERPLLRSDRHHPAFILTCKISYLKYISLEFEHNWPPCIDDCVKKFDIIIRESFDRFVSFYYSVD
jgi:hypothetical protein